MIEVCLKIPSITIFIKGDIEDDSLSKKMSELFLKPEINLLRADTNTGDAIMIPASNIAYIKNVKEGA